jgi:reductive dehalogenase
LETLTFILILVISGVFSAAAITSLLEGEKKAALKLVILGLVIALPFIFILFIPFGYNAEAATVLIILAGMLAVMMVLPFGRNPKYTTALPGTRIDERDTMFSRNELKPGSKHYFDYYQKNPGKKSVDDTWRKEAGLLKPGSTQYHPLQFASADASFDTIEALKDKVDGPVHHQKIRVNPEEITRYIKEWAKKLGAIDAGVTLLQDYHMYSVGGRADRYGKVYERKHTHAIAFTVEMAKTMVDAAPSGSIVMESGQQYLESGKIAIQLANFIRKLGYGARAHIDGNYEVVCPLVARDAGLGEIGRMGLLMTPGLGPRVRIAVVTTTLPLETNIPLNDKSMIHFCTLCKKCADACPGKAISHDGQSLIEGELRWQINQEACFSLWCRLGTDCGRCISVCPYAHPDNFMHNLVRKGIRNSILFRQVALWLDDYIYGRKPVPKKVPSWMDIGTSNQIL